MERQSGTRSFRLARKDQNTLWLGGDLEMGLGIAVGVAAGLLMGNLGLGIALGVVFGAAWNARSKRA